jgi:hypothetical protein
MLQEVREQDNGKAVLTPGSYQILLTNIDI